MTLSELIVRPLTHQLVYINRISDRIVTYDYLLDLSRLATRTGTSSAKQTAQGQGLPLSKQTPS